MRYAILTDIHANFHALKAIEADVERMKNVAIGQQIGAAHDEDSGDQTGQETNGGIRYWFLGDLIGYGSEPGECIRWLAKTANIANRWVPGNHDEWLIYKSKVSADAEQSLARNEDSLAEPAYKRWRDWFMTEVEEAVRDETRSLVVENFTDITVAYTHASVIRSLRRTTYLNPWQKQKLEAEFNAVRQEVVNGAPTTLLFCGHTHFPKWAYLREDRVHLKPIAYNRPMPLGEGLFIINPGSVGQPRDGDPRAAYLLFDPIQKTIEFRRVLYDVEGAIQSLRAKGYPYSLQERLRSGDGREQLQDFHSRAYHRWDLVPVEEE